MPRTDQGAEGIHLLWTWPDVLPLSIGGYDIQRIESREARWAERCEVIDRRLIGYLAGRGEHAAPLGPLRMQADVTFQPYGDNLDLFIQELIKPEERVSVQVTGKLAVAMALSQGKVTQVAQSTLLPADLLLEAAEIDMVLVYVLEPVELRICAYQREDEIGTSWDQAPYIVKGLTLPIHETDPALTTPGHEYGAAHARLVAGEHLTHADFTRLTATLRQPAADTNLGRSGERVVLVRADDTQSYEEMPFDMQLSALAAHPKGRRVLGFGYRDHHGLQQGHAYMYRLTGRFRAEDLTDNIYDVHRVPAGTTVPAACTIGDLGLRFQTPVQVVLDPAPSATALQTASRRGIRIDTTGWDSSWWLPELDGWSAIIEFPRPVTAVTLEVAKGHDFQYAGGLPWAFGFPPPAPLPPGPVVPLTFPAPVTELRLTGTGTLFAIRLPSGLTGVRTLHAYTGPILYDAEPLPEPPPWLGAVNLQQPQTPISGPIDESTPVPPRPPAGFALTWLPHMVAGLPGWPAGLDSGPPIDALAYQIQHRVVAPTAGPWEPITGDDNLTFGSRDDQLPDVRLEFGCDLDALFPAIRPRSPGSVAMHLSDVFGQADPFTGTVLWPAQPFGSYHQYRIGSVDAVGRISASMTDSNEVRLEKHIPPPLPVGPQPEPVPDPADPHPLGPRARAIIAGAPGLTQADITLLGAHQNAIVLQWGWRQSERDLDPTTAEFRVYSTAPADTITGTITNVASAAPNWQIWLTTSLPLVADELAGQWITSGGYPFKIEHNDAGISPSMLVDVSALDPNTSPVLGPVTFGRPLAPAHQRAGGWDERVAVYPVTAADTYQHIFYDVLNLSVDHPKDALWVGVSAADAEPYVPDERTTGNLANRPGNESGIVTCGITARYRGQPVFSVPPPLGDVPELVTDEPTGRQVLVSLDLDALLSGALPSGSPCTLERCAADDILSRTSVQGSGVVFLQPDGTPQVITFPNPADEAAVIATLTSNSPQRLANKYLMHLLAASADPAAFFQVLSADVHKVGPVDDRLAPKPGRYLYFVRAADALGNTSAGGAILPVVVRVPSTAGAAKPERQDLASAGGTVTLTVAVTGADPDTTTVLLFAAIEPIQTDPLIPGEAELLRVPNRPDLYPAGGLRLQLDDGTLLPPVLAKDLADPDVTIKPDGTRVAALTFPATAGSWAVLWCYGLTRDGLPSYVCGPYVTGVQP